MINKKSKIIWHDAVIYGPNFMPRELTSLETVGEIAVETTDYLVIKDPLTRNLRTGRPHPEKQPIFYYIPRSFIEKIETV